MAGEPHSLNGTKRAHHEMASFAAGVGSKSRPCTKFFSISGCPFGEKCHFLHFIHGGMAAVSQMNEFGKPLPENSVAVSGWHDRLKTRMCKNVNSEEGCKFGDKCHFAHNEMELGEPSSAPGMAAAASFGQSATASISVEASHAGCIIGKGGSNVKYIHRQTGARLTVKDHDIDPFLKSIQLEGTFDQIDGARKMVKQLLAKNGMVSTFDHASQSSTATPINIKSKLCENFSNGTCKFGDRCHFAHGVSELRRG